MSLILIVDDEPGVLQIVGDWLKTDGYEVAAAGSAEEAMAWFRQTDRRPNAALLDIKLPGANGFELADWLAEDFDFRRRFFSPPFSGKTKPGRSWRPGNVRTSKSPLSSQTKCCLF